MRAIKLGNRILTMAHAYPIEVARILQDAGWITSELKDAIEVVSDRCPSCTMTGSPAPSKKISLSNVRKEFYEKIQDDFTYLAIRGQVYHALHIVEPGTGFRK